MPRKPPPPVTIGMDRAQKMSAAAPMATDGIRLAGARAVPIEQIVPDPHQPRRDWDDAESVTRLAELAASITEFGVLQPLLVREDSALDDGRARYIIIAGGRRRAAAESAGLTTLPVVIRDEDAARVRLLQLVENIQRRALAPLDEARAYEEIIDAEGISAEALGQRLHISGQHVRERLRLLEDQAFADAVQRREISATVARDIMRLPDDEIARFRVRVLAGERLQSNDIAAARARLDAAGVTNPRRKGGGRPAREAPTTAAPAPEMQRQGVRDQATLDAPPAQELAREALPPTDQATLDAVDAIPGDATRATPRDTDPPFGPRASEDERPAGPGEHATPRWDDGLSDGDWKWEWRAFKHALRRIDEAGLLIELNRIIRFRALSRALSTAESTFTALDIWAAVTRAREENSEEKRAQDNEVRDAEAWLEDREREDREEKEALKGTPGSAPNGPDRT